MKPIRLISSLSLAAMGLYLMYQSRPAKTEDVAKDSQSMTAAVPNSPTESPVLVKESDVKQRFAATLKKLPTTASLQSLTANEVHSTPQVLKSAAFEIGQIQAELKANPEAKPQAFEFYKSCATQNELAIQVRAMCYHYGRSLGDLNAAAIPENVKDLAKGMVD